MRHSRGRLRCGADAGGQHSDDVVEVRAATGRDDDGAGTVQPGGEQLLVKQPHLGEVPADGGQSGVVRCVRERAFVPGDAHKAKVLRGINGPGNLKRGIHTAGSGPPTVCAQLNQDIQNRVGAGQGPFDQRDRVH